MISSAVRGKYTSCRRISLMILAIDTLNTDGITFGLLAPFNIRILSFYYSAKRKKKKAPFSRSSGKRDFSILF